MNTNRIIRAAAGASLVLAVATGLAACGDETVTTEPTSQLVPAKVQGTPSGKTADALERKLAADKARQDKASIDRWDRTPQQLEYKGHPGRY